MLRNDKTKSIVETTEQEEGQELQPLTASQTTETTKSSFYLEVETGSASRPKLHYQSWFQQECKIRRFCGDCKPKHLLGVMSLVVMSLLALLVLCGIVRPTTSSSSNLSFGLLSSGHNNINSDNMSHQSSPTFQSDGHSRYGEYSYDEAFDLALQEISQNIQPQEGTFVAGAGWNQLWTRDTSYAVQLSLSLLHPHESQTTLETCTAVPDDDEEQERLGGGKTWLQDVCGHFGGWPNLSDAVVGIQGAWSLYLATGKETFLRDALEISNRTLVWAELDVFDQTSGLFKGCSSFMESNSGYPIEYTMNGIMVGATKALSTNVLYYNGYKYTAMMMEELLRLENRTATKNEKEIIQNWEDKAAALGDAIRTHLWMEDRGYYAYFQDAGGTLVQQMEGLGESLLLLAPGLELNSTRIRRILNNTHRTPKGLPCLWPQFEEHEITNDVSQYYHNGRIWPFVQGYWALAAARHGKVDIFEDELSSIVELAMWNETFAEFYELDGSYLHVRRRQLWSSAGYAGMVIHGLFGLELEPLGIRFLPIKPDSFQTTMKLENLVYRNARLAIHVSGYGTNINTFRINGKIKDEPFLESNTQGDQLIEINLKASKS